VSTTGLVGGNTLPVDAGVLNTDIGDIAVDGILDYLAFWIKNSLDSKIANMQASPTEADACPSANRFNYDPEDGGGGIYARNPTPALYVWWDGNSQFLKKTTLWTHVQREIHAMYIYDEIVLPGDSGARHGLLPIVNATFAKAAERGYHPSYGYNGDPVGTPIYVSLSLANLGLIYMGGSPGVLWEVPGKGTNTMGGIQRGFPALKAKFLIEERIEQDIPSDSDALIDASLSINANDGFDSETIPYVDRELEGPDGADEEP